MLFDIKMHPSLLIRILPSLGTKFYVVYYMPAIVRTMPMILENCCAICIRVTGRT